jgi:hypothetical protein
VRITIRVRPGSARPGVGGEQGGALVVRVSRTKVVEVTDGDPRILVGLLGPD